MCPPCLPYAVGQGAITRRGTRALADVSALHCGAAVVSRISVVRDCAGEPLQGGCRLSLPRSGRSRPCRFLASPLPCPHCSHLHASSPRDLFCVQRSRLSPSTVFAAAFVPPPAGGGILALHSPRLDDTLPALPLLRLGDVGARLWPRHGDFRPRDSIEVRVSLCFTVCGLCASLGDRSSAAAGQRASGG